MFKVRPLFCLVLLFSLSPALQAQTQEPETSLRITEQVLSNEKRIYTQQCSFCHTPKPANTQPDLQAWIRLLYTSACPQVTVTLTEAQRQSIKRYFEQALKTAQQ